MDQAFCTGMSSSRSSGKGLWRLTARWHLLSSRYCFSLGKTPIVLSVMRLGLQANPQGCRPVMQNLQAILHPAWELTHSVFRSWSGIITASTNASAFVDEWSSTDWGPNPPDPLRRSAPLSRTIVTGKRYFRVPSRDVCTSRQTPVSPLPVRWPSVPQASFQVNVPSYLANIAKKYYCAGTIRQRASAVAWSGESTPAFRRASTVHSEGA